MQVFSILRAVAFLAFVVSQSAANTVIDTPPANATQRICVLNFERPEHGITEVLATVFSNVHDSEVRNLATPRDLLECIRGGTEEIVIIAHAVQSTDQANENRSVDLGYFRKLTQDEQRENGPTEDGYVIRSFLPKAMRAIRDELRSQVDAGKLRLKKVRWLSCMPQQVFTRYPDLYLALTENSIEIDLAPKNELMSWIHGEEVVTPSLEWLAKSIDCGRLKAWRTDRNRDCREDWWPGCNRKTARICLPSMP